MSFISFKASGGVSIMFDVYIKCERARVLIMVFPLQLIVFIVSRCLENFDVLQVWVYNCSLSSLHGCWLYIFQGFQGEFYYRINHEDNDQQL